jgi:hypothetical protein
VSQAWHVFPLYACLYVCGRKSHKHVCGERPVALHLVSVCVPIYTYICIGLHGDFAAALEGVWRGRLQDPLPPPPPYFWSLLGGGVTVMPVCLYFCLYVCLSVSLCCLLYVCLCRGWLVTLLVVGLDRSVRGKRDLLRSKRYLLDLLLVVGLDRSRFCRVHQYISMHLSVCLCVYVSMRVRVCLSLSLSLSLSLYVYICMYLYVRNLRRMEKGPAILAPRE